MVGVSGRGGKNSKAVRELKAAGNKAMQSGAFQKAMRLYTRALDLDAGNAILYSNRSAAHFNLRQFAESLEDAESAILCDSMWWKAYKRKGLALIHIQKYEDAIEALEEGLKIVKKNAEMEKNLEFAKACQEQAQNLYILPEPPMMQRLESVPVFIVTDSVGQPFFVTYDDGQQVCTFYFDQEDANATLEWITSENPGLGDTARVIHITLHQAFNLAQETQKQYYEETTRAAAEEDLRAAAEAAANKGEKVAPVIDVDGDEKSDEADEDKDGAGNEEGTPDTEVKAEKESEATEGKTDDAIAKEEVKDGKEEETKQSDEEEEGDKNEGDEKEDEKEDDGIIDENAPLSFQFRPELRQVKVAVELLNKNPDPPVKPILRDPPSVRKAKAEAAAAAKETEDIAGGAEDEEAKDDKEGATEGEAKEVASGAEDEEAKDDKEGTTEGEAKEVASGAEDEEAKDDKEGTTEGESKEVASGAEDEKARDDKEGATEGEGEAKEGHEGEAKEGQEGEEEKADKDKLNVEEEDVELTVDNFNGIPIFQAKGLTLLQKNKQLIPLFFSKWDLEDAWKQLKESNAMDVPGECEIDVGTLEDVLRRMSESKTDEFQSVFFVPSRESMKAINVKFPLDDLASSNPAAGQRSLGGKPAVKKAGFSRAKQIAARGGTKDEVRAAIREDLEKHAERQKMAEIIAQIEQAGRTGSVGGLGRVSPTSSSSGASSANGKSSKAGKTQKATAVS